MLKIKVDQTLRLQFGELVRQWQREWRAAHPDFALLHIETYPTQIDQIPGFFGYINVREDLADFLKARQFPFEIIDELPTFKFSPVQTSSL